MTTTWSPRWPASTWPRGPIRPPSPERGSGGGAAAGVTVRIDDLGEFALIDRIVARLGDAAANDIIVPPGDDAAVWDARDSLAVVTIDALVEGTHFRADTMSMADLGWRAVAANVSDLAAMGAEPQYLLIATMLAPELPLAAIDALVDGIAEGCR